MVDLGCKVRIWGKNVQLWKFRQAQTQISPVSSCEDVNSHCDGGLHNTSLLSINRRVRKNRTSSIMRAFYVNSIIKGSQICKSFAYVFS